MCDALSVRSPVPDPKAPPASVPPAHPSLALLLFVQGCKGLHSFSGPTEVPSGHDPVPGHSPESRQHSKGG